MTARRVVLTAAACLAAASTYIACAALPGPRCVRAFDPDRVAELEVDMWRASVLPDLQAGYEQIRDWTHASDNAVNAE